MTTHGHKITGLLNGDAEHSTPKANKLCKFTIVYNDDDKKIYNNCVVWGDVAVKFKDMKAGFEVEAIVAYGKVGQFNKKASVEYVIKDLRILNDVPPEPEPEVTKSFL